MAKPPSPQSGFAASSQALQDGKEGNSGAGNGLSKLDPRFLKSPLIPMNRLVSASHLRSTIPSRRMRFGAEVADDGVSFRLWAPRSKRVALAIVGEVEPRPMQAGADGFHEIRVENRGPGT